MFQSVISNEVEKWERENKWSKNDYLHKNFKVEEKIRKTTIFTKI